MVRYPPWYSASDRHICAIPDFATYRGIIVRYPIKTNTKYLAILSLQVSRDMKSIAAGPISASASVAHRNPCVFVSSGSFGRDRCKMGSLIFYHYWR